MTNDGSLFVRPAAPGLLLIAALLGIAASAILMLARMYAVAGEVPPPVVAFAVVPVLAAGAVCLRRRWAPIPGGVVGGLITLMLAPHLPHTLAVPADALFTPFVLLFGCALLATVLGAVAALQNRRAPGRSVPRWLPLEIAATCGAIAGILLMGALPRQGGATGIAEEALSRLPVVEADRFEFVQQEIRVRAGATVAIRLENRDAVSHSFDADEFDVHVLMPPGETALAVFTPLEPGTFTFYCAPHYDRKTGRGMKGTLIVEP